MSVLGHLEPKSVFGYFEEICGIPHGSGNMEKISQFCVDFAKEHGLEYIVDDMKNVIIIKEATPGYEDVEPLIIQGHLDMVCDKRPDKEKDFLTEGLDLCTDGELIWADGTTLGGDDGIAVAYGLALLAAKDLQHPRLEVVLTVDEETGLYGAEAIDMSMLKGKKLINIDSEDEGIFTVGCAGGLTLGCDIPMFTEEVEGIVYELKVTGLLGGHSGVEIHKGRANANVVLGRVLFALNKEIGVDIVKMAGGAKDNAIPRNASAEILVAEEAQEKLAEIVSAQEAILKNELHASDADVALVLEKKGTATVQVLDATSKISALHTLNNIPNGIQAYSMDIEGLVETSLNMGIMSMDGENLKMSFAVRSSVESAKRYLTDRVMMFVDMLGGSCEIKGDYPGWAYRPESALRETFIRVYERMYGKKPVVEAIHAGLECGLFTKKIDDLDSISVGPNMHNVHTSEETLEVASVQRTWEFLCQVIAENKDL
ncbi:MAG: aminoacyl-histidine dipeptidase [Lachnospiraceae bacterium]|nr:aminoacyl-histidine dipeptidase [Lachnospiraceae bacterium]